jgi:hypothetical protein
VMLTMAVTPAFAQTMSGSSSDPSMMPMGAGSMMMGGAGSMMMIGGGGFMMPMG